MIGRLLCRLGLHRWVTIDHEWAHHVWIDVCRREGCEARCSGFNYF